MRTSRKKLNCCFSFKLNSTCFKWSQTKIIASCWLTTKHSFSLDNSKAFGTRIKHPHSVNKNWTKLHKVVHFIRTFWISNWKHDVTINKDSAVENKKRWEVQKKFLCSISSEHLKNAVTEVWLLQFLLIEINRELFEPTFMKKEWRKPLCLHLTKNTTYYICYVTVL